MSPKLISEVGDYAQFRNDRFYRDRIQQLALPARQYRYLLYEVNWQLFVLENMQHLKHRGDDYLDTLPEFFRTPFNEFRITLHLSELREMSEKLTKYGPF